MPVDAVYLDLHGAMVTETYEDAEGELLRRIRAVVGPEIPVVISLDYHANVTPAMVEYSEGMAAYRPYPHVDRNETGERAARILYNVLESCPTTVLALRNAALLARLTLHCTRAPPHQ